MRMAERERALYERIVHVFDELRLDPFLGKPLKGELKGRYSYRIGNYRIIYRIEHDRLIIIIIDIGHRRDIYR